MIFKGKRKMKVGIILIICSLLFIFTAEIFSDSSPKWLRFNPEIILSQEGFRDVKWATRIKDISWEWSKSHFPAMGYWRKNEEQHVFEVDAKWITYTFRNNIFYGVRIDIESNNDVQKAMESVLRKYPPEKDVVTINDLNYSWNTKYTQVWITLPEKDDGLGTIYLWGIDQKFPDASIRPLYLIPPPALNSNPQPYVPRYYVIYRATDTITIDGDINEKAWQDAEWLDSFIDHQYPYAPSPWKTTRVKMIYDAEYVYVAAQLQEENVWGHLSKRDAIVYYDNDFEIFLDPTANGINYFEFELNALNTMFDMWHELDNWRGAYADPVFDSKGTRHAIKVDGTLNYHYDIDKGWNVEVKIPLKELKEWNPEMSYPIKRGDIWRINFSRVQYMHVYTQLFPYLLPFSPSEDWVLGPTDTGDLHIPELWPIAVFSDFYCGETDDALENKRPKVITVSSIPKNKKKGMVHFPAGTINIGPDPKDKVHSPAYQVIVPEFWMDRYEVSVAEFTVFLNKGGNDQYYSSWMQIPERCGIIRDGDAKYSVVQGRENYPVTYVSHDAALAYAKSFDKTLPTEEMWERAARGLEGRMYPWGNENIDTDMANYNFYYGGTTPVGSFSKGATPDGIFDMAGNVKEWTNSKFKPYPGGKAFEHRWIEFWYDPIPEPLVYWWVNRGGGWTKQDTNMESAYRDGQGHMNVGFRCVKLVK